MKEDIVLDARKKAKHNGDEDPLVIAQRFLNIYRQIHIFSPDKKEAFNEMVLELSPEVRGMFGQIPGGVLLQEYIDDLAEQRGIEKHIPSNINIQGQYDADTNQAKILATALAQASTQIQNPGMSTPASAPTNVTINPASAKLSMDGDFAKEFATTLGNVLQQNAGTQHDEIKKIALAMNQGHLSFLKTMQTENHAHREEMKKISMAMLQIQQKAVTMAQANTAQQTTDNSMSKQLIQMFLSNQQNVLEKIAQLEEKTKNTNLQNNDSTNMWQKSEQRFEKIASLLYAGQKNTFLEISRLINDNQQNLLKMMLQNNNQNQNSGNASASNNIQINSSDYTAVLNNIADKLGALNTSTANVEVKFPKHALGDLIEAQSKLYREIAKNQTKELSSVITEAFRESQKASTQSIIDALNFHKQPIIMSQQEVISPIVDQETNHRDDENKNNDNSSGNIVFAEQEADTLADETPILEQKKKKKKKIAEQESITTDTSSNFFDIQNSDEVFLQTESSSDNSNISTNDLGFFTTDSNMASAEVYEQPDVEEKDFTENELALEIANEQDFDTDINQNTEPSVEFSSKESENESEISNFGFFDDVVSGIENSTSIDDVSSDNENTEDASSWGFIPDKDSNYFETQETSDTNSFETPDNWGFSDENIEKTEEDEGVEGIDWEWEYVEDDQQTEGQNNEARLQPLGANSRIYTGEIIFDSGSINCVNETKGPLENNIIFHNYSIYDNLIDDEETKDPYLK